MLKKIVLSFLVLFSVSNAKMFQSVPLEQATLVQKGDDKLYCPNCGMNLPKFYKTNHVHEGHQYCSMHCLVEATHGQVPADAKVVDTKSLKFIDAKKAFYVVGSKMPGTMSMNSKYAFANEADAKTFQGKNGGKIMNFDEAYKAAQSDFPKDTMMIDTKKHKKMYKNGKMMYNKMCHSAKLDLDKFETIGALKAHLSISGVCGKNIEDQKLQAISVYVWDVLKNNKGMSSHAKIDVPKDAKCPVCGMFVAKYPKWAAKLTHGDHIHYFDGVKDLMKIVLSGDYSKSMILVTDYYTTNAIDARKAFYVLGSNVFGPMGDELIPFSTEEKAKDFAKNHDGMKILKFNEITTKTIDSLGM